MARVKRSQPELQLSFLDAGKGVYPKHSSASIKPAPANSPPSPPRASAPLATGETEGEEASQGSSWGDGAVGEKARRSALGEGESSAGTAGGAARGDGGTKGRLALPGEQGAGESSINGREADDFDEVDEVDEVDEFDELDGLGEEETRDKVTESEDKKKTASATRRQRGRRATAESMAEGQREISISEFFTKNRHLLGFDNPSKALLTTVKEAVDNSLDACEEAGILPEIEVEIAALGEDRFRVCVEDNGPGIVRAQIPKVFGKLLYGSKFHRLKQSRGQQGIGISAAVMYGQLTSGRPARVLSRTGRRRPAMEFQVRIDTRNNMPDFSEEVIEWTRPAQPLRAAIAAQSAANLDPGPMVKKIHGTRVEIEMDANYTNGQRSVLRYLEQTALANPHATIRYLRPRQPPLEFPRSTDELPRESIEIKPHPHGIELGMLMQKLMDNEDQTVKMFLRTSFSRIGPKPADEICKVAGIGVRSRTHELSQDQVEALHKALINAKLPAPPTSCLSPIGDELMRRGLISFLSVLETEDDLDQEAIAAQAQLTLQARGKSGRKSDSKSASSASRPSSVGSAESSASDSGKSDSSAGSSSSAGSVGSTSGDIQNSEAGSETSSTSLKTSQGQLENVQGSGAIRAGDQSPAAQARAVAQSSGGAGEGEGDQSLEIPASFDEQSKLATEYTVDDHQGQSELPGTEAPKEELEEGEENIKGKRYFIATVTRPPKVYRGNPFQVEVGLAYGGSWPADKQIELYRMANRVPLLFQRSACGVTDAVLKTPWRNYEVSQPRGGLPVAPMALLIHIASVWVPFTSESKEAIAHYPEIVAEVKLALQEVGRKLATHLRKKKKADYEIRRRNLFALYIDELAHSLSKLTGRDREEIHREFTEMSLQITAGADFEKELAASGRKQKKPKAKADDSAGSEGSAEEEKWEEPEEGAELSEGKASKGKQVKAVRDSEGSKAPKGTKGTKGTKELRASKGAKDAKTSKTSKTPKPSASAASAAARSKSTRRPGPAA